MATLKRFPVLQTQSMEGDIDSYTMYVSPKYSVLRSSSIILAVHYEAFIRNCVFDAVWCLRNLKNLL